MNTPSLAVLLTLQQIAGAITRLQQRGSVSRNLDDLSLAEAVRDRFVSRPYFAAPLPAWHTGKAGHERLVCSPDPVDRIIDEALRPELGAAIEPVLDDAVHAYRRGRSTYTAAVALSNALANKHHHLRLLDIANYYESIDRATLAEMLRSRLRAGAFELLMAQLAAPLRLEGKIVERPIGIPTGRSLSPVVANAYLADLDAHMRTLPCTYLRYGDDLAIAASEVDMAQQCEYELRQALAKLQLDVSERKTKRIEYLGVPVLYLGHLVDERGVYERLSEARLTRLVGNGPPPVKGNEPGNRQSDSVTARVPVPRVRTLYLTEPGIYLSSRDGFVLVRRGSDVLREIPLRTVDRVMILAGAAMSSGFMSACVVRNIPVLVFVGKGRAYGSLVASGMPNPLRLRAQYDLLADRVRRLEVVRAVVVAKLDAMQRRLRNVRSVRAQCLFLRHLAKRAADVQEVNALRGLEGRATKTYYECFAQRIHKPSFAFKGRSRRPPLDPINSLLSFSYSLIFAEMQTSLLACGLDPHAGLFHELRPGHPALASDLIEPYRALVADTFVLSLINRGVVSVDDFHRERGGVFINADARRTVLVSYEGFMVRALGGARGRTTPRGLIQGAGRAFLKVVLGEAQGLVLPLVHADDAADEELT